MAIAFTIPNLSKEEEEDLRRRIIGHRKPQEFDIDVGWSYGFPSSKLEPVINYWLNSYSWSDKVAEMNKFKHYKMPVETEGQTIEMHFIHEPALDEQGQIRKDAIPLVLVHGWPGSFWEFKDVIRRLSNPREHDKAHPEAQAFHVVVPSLPGYGYSSAPKVPAFGVGRMADTIDELMVKLGYDHYVAQGGDWGSFVAQSLNIFHSDHCEAAHVNMLTPFPPLSIYTPMAAIKAIVGYAVGADWLYPKGTAANLKRMQNFWQEETGYQQIQGTKPQSLAWAVGDSPVGLCAWILEKFHTWTFHPDYPQAATVKSTHTPKQHLLYNASPHVLPPTLSLDDVLTVIMIYWTTNTAASSFRLYYEAQHGQELIDLLVGKKKHLTKSRPLGVAVFAQEVFRPVREWAELSHKIIHWSDFDVGGHFAAMEEPDLFLYEVQTFGKVLKREGWWKY